MLEVDMRTRKVLVAKLQDRYRRAGKGAKGKLLDEFVALTGYNRCYARRVLRKGHQECRKGSLIGGSQGRPKKYSRDVLGSLKKIWGVLNFACGKRLVAMMKEMVSVLEKWGELHCTKDVKTLLTTMSASTADRLLRSERKKLQLKGRSGTKPGSLLKHKIPIRTFADWDNAKPGFLQIDLVGHEGGNARGDFCQTLDATDVATGWTEPRAIRNKAQVWVTEAMDVIRQRFPFTVLGINSDDGSEFINANLFRYCQTHKITFTRSRENRKNDNCYVEQKNYAAVRQLVGYYRYDTPEELALLHKLYALYGIYANFFQPQMKLTEKTRIGSKVVKKYDRPLTPFARVCASKHIPNDVKEMLRVQYVKLNPAKLRRDMLALQEKLYKLVALKYEISKGKKVTEHMVYATAS